MREKMIEINNKMMKGYDFLSNEHVIEACDTWLEVWEGIKALNNSKYASIEDFDADHESDEKYSNWCQDLEMEFENAAFEDKKYYHKRIQFCREFIDIFPDSKDFTVMSMKTAEAESYFEIGEIEKSEDLFKKVADEYEGTVWPYIKWGDIYWLSNILRERKDLLSLEKSEEIYKRALDIGDEEDEYIIKERLNEIQDIKRRLKK